MRLLAQLYLIFVMGLTLALIPVAFGLTYLFPIRFPQFLEACFETYDRILWR